MRHFSRSTIFAHFAPLRALIHRMLRYFAKVSWIIFRNWENGCSMLSKIDFFGRRYFHILCQKIEFREVPDQCRRAVIWKEKEEKHYTMSLRNLPKLIKNARKKSVDDSRAMIRTRFCHRLKRRLATAFSLSVSNAEKQTSENQETLAERYLCDRRGSRVGGYRR